MSVSGRVSLPGVQEWSVDPADCPGVGGALTDIRKACWMFGGGGEVLSDVREWLGGPPGCPRGPLGCLGVVGRPSRMSRSGRESIECPVVVGNSSRMSGRPAGCPVVGGRPSRMTGSGRVALPGVQEWSADPADCPGVVGGPHGYPEGLPDVQEWSGVPLGYPGVVGRFSRMSGSGWESFPDVQEWSGDPAKCPGVVGGPHESLGLVGMPSWMCRSGREACRMSGSGRKSIPNVQEWCRPSRMSESGGWPFRVSRSGRETPPNVQEWSDGPLGCPGVVGRKCQMFGSGVRPSRMFRSGL